MPSPAPIIIITDLDGTLLDHDSYLFDAALPTLNLLKQQNIPLLLNSSKTAAEMLVIREQLDNDFPFIVENGAGIYLPNNEGYDIIRFGEERETILKLLKQIRTDHDLPFIGFNDMTIEELMADTGLDRKAAENAKQRDFTEPLRWLGNDAQCGLFCTEMEQADLKVVKGGRFHCVSSKVDKGQALQWLRDYYQTKLDDSPVFIALGDSDNDKPMLESADYAVLVRSTSHDLPEINSDKLIITNETGPLAWNNSLRTLLEKINHIHSG